MLNAAAINMRPKNWSEWTNWVINRKNKNKEKFIFVYVLIIAHKNSDRNLLQIPLTFLIPKIYFLWYTRLLSLEILKKLVFGNL